jgi:hypothetical protein
MVENKSHIINAFTHAKKLNNMVSEACGFKSMTYDNYLNLLDEALVEQLNSSSKYPI